MNNESGSAITRSSGYLLPDGTPLPRRRPLSADFPRSDLMRFMVNPRNRRLLKASASILTLLLSRSRGPRQTSLLDDIAQLVARETERRG